MYGRARLKVYSGRGLPVGDGIFSGIGKVFGTLGKVVLAGGKIAAGIASQALPGGGLISGFAKSFPKGLVGNMHSSATPASMSASSSAGPTIVLDPNAPSVQEMQAAAKKSQQKYYGPYMKHRRKRRVIDVTALNHAISRMKKFEKVAKSALIVHNFKSAGHLRVGHLGRKRA